MINQTFYELEASKLSSVTCPDCGKTHEVKLRCDDRGAFFYSLDEAGSNCEGFKELVRSRLANVQSREKKERAELLLRRSLGDPSL